MNYNPETIWVKDQDGDGYYTGDPYIGCLFIGATGFVRKTTQLPGDCNIMMQPLTRQLFGTGCDEHGYSNPIYIGLPSCTPPQDGQHYITSPKGVDCNDGDATYNPETIWVVDQDGDGYYSRIYSGCLFIGATGYGRKTTQLPGIAMIMMPRAYGCSVLYRR